MRYFIEQDARRFYGGSELSAAKRRAARLSKMYDGGVCIIAEQFDRETLDYVPCGSIAYYGGAQDAKEGCFA